MRQNKQRFCGAYLFNFTEMPLCSAALRQSSKWLTSHPQVTHAVCNMTAFCCPGTRFGQVTKVKANELCKSKKDIRNNYIIFYFILWAMLKHHWNAYTVMTMNKCPCTTDQQGLCEIYHNITRNIYSNDMCSSKRVCNVKKKIRLITDLSYLHIQLCAIPCA